MKFKINDRFYNQSMPNLVSHPPLASLLSCPLHVSLLSHPLLTPSHLKLITLKRVRGSGWGLQRGRGRRTCGFEKHISKILFRFQPNFMKTTLN